jgi:WD40 repeat protein
MRLCNIKRNQGLLVELGIEDLTNQMKREKKSTVRAKKVKVEPSSPARRSLRGAGCDPDGAKFVQKESDFDVRNPFHAKFGVFGSDPNCKELIIAKNRAVDRLGDDPITTAGSFGSFVTPGKSKASKKAAVSKKAYLAKLQQLSIHDDEEVSVGKVMPERGFSLAWHPSASTRTVVSGDKWGNVGCWNTAAPQGKNGKDISSFQPHCRPVTKLMFLPHDTNKLYSSAWDGTIRVTDFAASGSLTSRLVYGTEIVDKPEWNGIKSFDIYGQTLIAARGDGQVAITDLRCKAVRASGLQCHQLHGKKGRTANQDVNTVHVRAADGGHYLATSSKDKSVKIWDLRKLAGAGGKNGKSSSSTCITTLGRSKSVNSAFWSPCGGMLLTTSMDDRICIYNSADVIKKAGKKASGSIDPHRSIIHNNQTGRWLTKFQAVWDPKLSTESFGTVCQNTML